MFFYFYVSVQFNHVSSAVSDSSTPWSAACQASWSFTTSRSLLKFMSISQWYYPTISCCYTPFSSCPQYFPASESFPMSRLFTSRGQSIGASASILPMIIILDWFDLLAVQVTLKSLLQHSTLKASFFQCSAFFMVQLSHPYIGKTIALTRRT